MEQLKLKVQSKQFATQASNDTEIAYEEPSKETQEGDTERRDRPGILKG
jgi:hypothetical protein